MAVKGKQLKQLCAQDKASHTSRSCFWICTATLLASSGDAYLLFWTLGSWCCAQAGPRSGSANATSVCPSSILSMHVHLTQTGSELEAALPLSHNVLSCS